jgi:putative ABC transport system substrate-binding protein
MNRREVITILGSAAAGWPFGARAQQAGKLPTIGFLGVGAPSNWSGWVTAFVQRLRELGWVEGRNIAITYRWAEGRDERFAEIADEFVRMRVDVIVTGGGAVLAAKHATSVIPIVFAVANDPVGAGYVASLARPEGNVTGLTIQAPDLAGKRIELLHEVVPDLRTLAILGNVGNAGTVREINEAATLTRARGLEVATLEISRADDVAPAFEALKGRANALYVCTDALIVTNNVRINTFALISRLPTIYSDRMPVAAGGLMSYGPNGADLFRRELSWNLGDDD